MCDRLSGIIGVRGCGDEPIEAFRYYINDYPGITTIQAAHIANSEQITGVGLLTSCIERAIRESMTDVIAEVGKLGNFWTGQEIKYGGKSRLTDTVISAGQSSEVEIYLCGPYQVAKIQEIRVWSSAIGVLTVVTENHETTSTNYDLVAGLNTISVDRTLIGDTTVTVTANVATRAWFWGEGTSCGCECDSYTNNFGLFFSKYCDLCELAYQYRESLAKVFWLKAAIIYFEEALVSPNQSQEARKGFETAKRSLLALLGGVDQASGLYLKGKYPEALKIAARQFNYEITRGNIPCCFSCEGSQIVFNIP